ncbi:MAG: SMC-Scp complex subunit ScpB [Nitrososphaerota archaeon]|nr:SMC-Scp complex subunit ScpB [Candidatus Bathyarchaeota archaeon]MDW8048983.1 SMC-Scp complex subunit ScpB [Nitrososphaerota archaeon]
MKAAQPSEPLEKSNEKMKEELALIEAALYVAGRPLDLRTIGRVLGTKSLRKVQSLARTLMNEYKRRETALEVLELEDQRFVLQLKSIYSPRVRKLALRPLLSDGPLKTLAYIAYRQPVLQKQVIAVRGKHSYDHIKQLISMGLVEYEKKGKNRVLKCTQYFADYFGLSHDLTIMKRQLRRIFKNAVNENTEDTDPKDENTPR